MVTLHGFLPPASPTLDLACSLWTERLTNGFTGKEEHHEILRASNGLYTYEWRITSLSHVTDDQSLALPGGFWITGIVSAIAALRNGKVSAS